MSGRNGDPDVEEELSEFFGRVRPPEPSARLRHKVTDARRREPGARRWGSRLAEDSRLGLSIVALAASIVLCAGLLLTFYGRGGVGIGGPDMSSESPRESASSDASPDASPSASPSETVSASPESSASPEIGPGPSILSSPSSTRDPALTFGPAGTFKAVAATTFGPSAAVRLPDGRVFLTDGARFQIYDPAVDRFGAIGTFDAPHLRGSATGLPDGTVLIVGGVDDLTGTTLRTALIFDPNTGKTTPTGNPIQARYDPHAVALADGKVLVLGGYATSNVDPPLREAEIYDPVTRAFTRTGDMVVSRGSATTTRLTDGRVLIAGGDRIEAPYTASLITAELFDPASGKFTATGSLTTGRDSAADALLPDGRVLISGGDTDFAEAGTADVYDPQTGTFTATGTMVTGRFSHNATTLADGRVLITGGYIEPGLVASRDPGVLAVTDNSYLNSAELYDPYTGKFTRIGPMLSRRVGHTATLLEDGRVLLVGGNLDATSAEAYVP